MQLVRCPLPLHPLRDVDVLPSRLTVLVTHKVLEHVFVQPVNVGVTEAKPEPVKSSFELDASRYLELGEVIPQRPLVVGPVEHLGLEADDRLQVVDDDRVKLDADVTTALRLLCLKRCDAVGEVHLVAA